MNTEAVALRVQKICGELGLSYETTQRIINEIRRGDSMAAPSMVSGSNAATEIEQLRAERDRLLEVQEEIMRLINAKSPDKILHDLRNVLNELSLLQAIAGDDE